MKRKTRTRILINGSSNLSEQLATQITDRYEVQMIEEPNNGLVMVKMEENAKKSLFYLGEVFVTECKVQINGQLGIGILKGDKPELSYYLAVIDAAYQAELDEVKGWIPLLLAEEENIAVERKEFDNKVLQTKVNFENMDVE
ncbi:phosphonate C-P lyase system protein PhnG [Pseudalkalibacillus decolorationis]|uniref:phosphonate C-P lyase system protein PhnG n=1 Tax=Pseudalkalibacillus decolorationis TaxID=163879 RepID=UPI0021497CDD|nr:phosphonate C-P lyase system protein PhnG [Pseudalkalibacillus decolorationis]